MTFVGLVLVAFTIFLIADQLEGIKEVLKEIRDRKEGENIENYNRSKD